LPNGSGYTISGKRLNKFATEAGAALEYNCGDWTFTANYDYVGRKHFKSSSGKKTLHRKAQRFTGHVVDVARKLCYRLIGIIRSDDRP
jgi:hypothetical protein